MPTTHPASLIFGRFELRPAQRLLLVDGTPASLGARALDLLCALVARRERVVQKDELLDVVWPGVVVEENNLQVHVSTLRKILGADAIATIPGRGYRFTAVIDDHDRHEELDAGAARAPEPGAVDASPLHFPQLVGRDDELRALGAMLREHAIVTIAGAGGMGKTVLARVAADAAREHFRDGVWFIELAAIQDSEALPGAVARALRISQAAPGTELKQIASVLASQSLLLVLDNCEHLVGAVGRLVATMTGCVPGLRVLSTSQELLNIDGEVVFRLDPLSIPDDGEIIGIEHFSAVRLFAERARRVESRFALASANAPIVAEICRRLDGVPLAIELAAARVHLLGVHELLNRLTDRFRLLTGGSRTAMPRHQTLAATMAWSHALLSAEEQRVLRRLSVFRGGFSLGLVQTVAADDALNEWEVLDALSGLVDKSLVVADPGDPPRYRLLESTRAYALDRLAEHDESDATQRRHAAAVRTLFALVDEACFGEDGKLSVADYMRRLIPELDNLRVAFAWAMVHDFETAIALVGTSGYLCRWLGLSCEGLDRILPLREQVHKLSDLMLVGGFWMAATDLGDWGRLTRSEMANASHNAAFAYRAVGQHRRLYRALYIEAWSLRLLGRVEESEACESEMHRIGRPSDPPWLRALYLNLKALNLLERSDYEEAAAILHEQRRLLADSTGQEVSSFICQNNLCVVLNCLQRFEEAITCAMSIVQDTGRPLTPTLGYTMFQLTHAQTLLGRLDDAQRTVRRAMPAWRRDGMLPFGCVHLAMLLAAKGRFADAARLDGRAQSHWRRDASGLKHVRRQAHEHTLTLLGAARIDPADLDRWLEEGAGLDDEAVATLCLRE